jgi:threonine/homoserine/homoserine lactone efflux protein
VESVSIGVVAAFWGVAIVFVLTPGADWAFAITAGLRSRVVPAVAGLLLGHLSATAVVAAGVGTLVAELPVLLTVLTVAGAGYLVWLGVSTLAHPASLPGAAGETERSAARWLARGFGVSGLNPKVLLLFLALLPQFVDTRATWAVPAQIVVLGLVHVASCAIVYTAVGVGARKVLGTRPAAARIVSRVSGGLMTALGLSLVIEQLVAHLAQ